MSPANRVPLAPTLPLEAPPLRPLDGLAYDAPLQLLSYPKLRHPLLRLLIFAVLVVVLMVAGGIAVAVTGRPIDLYTAGTLQLVTLSVAYLVLVLLIERRLPPLELDPRRLLGLPVGLALGALLILLAYGAITVLGGYRVDGLDLGADIWPMVFMAGLVAGVTEEFLFRGVLFRLGEELIGTWGSVVLSGLVFGLVHIGNPDATLWGAIAIALEAGLLFALLYVVTRSLWICIGLHATWNIVQGPVLGIAVSGTGEPVGLVKTAVVGPDWLTGGSFGAEASVVTVAIMLTLTAALGVLAVRRGLIVAPRWSRTRRMRERAALAPAGAVQLGPATGPVPPLPARPDA